MERQSEIIKVMPKRCHGPPMPFLSTIPAPQKSHFMRTAQKEGTPGVATTEMQQLVRNPIPLPEAVVKVVQPVFDRLSEQVVSSFLLVARNA